MANPICGYTRGYHWGAETSCGDGLRKDASYVTITSLRLGSGTWILVHGVRLWVLYLFAHALNLRPKIDCTQTYQIERLDVWTRASA